MQPSNNGQAAGTPRLRPNRAPSNPAPVEAGAGGKALPLGWHVNAALRHIEMMTCGLALLSRIQNIHRTTEEAIDDDLAYLAHTLETLREGAQAEIESIGSLLQGGAA